jgi:hypothetical protein
MRAITHPGKVGNAQSETAVSLKGDRKKASQVFRHFKKEKTMLCYRDMTFCRYWRGCAKGKTCDKALKPTIFRKATATGLPISQFMDTPDCMEPKTKRRKP